MRKISKALLIGVTTMSLAACTETEEAVQTEEVAAEEENENEVTEEVEEAEAETEEVQESAEVAAEQVTPEESEIELTHIHGLGITEEEGALYVPSHHGLMVFKEGVWSAAEGETHDYMGFAMVDNGFYTSGHPGEGSELANPFGVSRSTDMGQTLEMLDLYKEIDFHVMDVGYDSHAIYVVNPQPNSRMDQAGIHYSIDDAETWTYSAAEGLEGQLMSIGVHPADEAVVAAGTDQGVFVSEDYGQSFEAISDVPTTAVTFSPEGTLFTGGVTNAFTLTAFDITTGEQTDFAIPELSGQNAIGYIAINPQNEQEIYFSTFEKDIYLSEDGGETWTQIADKGIGIDFR
ncbi:F510_1955 family glycosylhydrolase [Planococcus lenghuensis]|uniref:Sortilin N-terminal domain-containing protein n=1 Tax=Planococcus lenghuensis TaxID=2213202 RepID=A0A1Q2KWP7_9BACL|nr:hypothetical protein [Planococcus lenghuensis]AQQ52645.1 hypothetical protein B0X71_05725 [Planococcus lenghuensis]